MLHAPFRTSWSGLVIASEPWTSSTVKWTVGWGIFALVCLLAIPGAFDVLKEAEEESSAPKMQLAVYGGIGSLIGFALGLFFFIYLLATHSGSADESDAAGDGRPASPPVASASENLSPSRSTQSPSPPGAQPAGVHRSYEAESAKNSRTENTLVADCEQCSGGQGVDLGGIPAAIRFPSVSVPSGGTYELAIHYRTARAPTATLTVNSRDPVVLEFPRVADYAIPEGLTVRTTLRRGGNVISITQRESTGYAPFIDRITIDSLP